MKAGLICGLLLLALPASAAATTFTVTKTGDSNDGSCTMVVCSLRDALTYSTSGDKVVVPAAGAPYAVSMGVLTVSHNLTISGAGAASTVVKNTGANSGVLAIDAATSVTVSNLTVTGGNITDANGVGAGISSAGNLVLDGVTVTGNEVQAGASGVPIGAGIYVKSGNLTLRSSTVSSNQLISPANSIPEGGGIGIDTGGGLVSIGNSQITGNVASAGDNSIPQGGGIFDGSAGTLAISSSQITGNAASAGNASIPDGGGVANEGGGVVTIDQTSVSSNTASAGTGSIPQGGGVFGHNFTVSASTFSGNSASAGSGSVAQGGGLFISDSTVSASTVSGNTANGADHEADGGGIYMSGNIALVNTTITANSDTTNGSGLSRGGGVFAAGSNSLLNSTIDGNSSPGGSGGSQGGDVFVSSGSPLTVENTIVSGGSATSGPNCKGSVTSQGHNVESGADCGFTGPGDRQNTDPRLGALQDNGGPTQTQVVQVGSPVIDAGNTADCPPTDQRGVSRPQGPACEVGAVEVEPPIVTSGAASGISQSAATLNATVTPNTLKASPAGYHFEWGTTTPYGHTTPPANTTTGSGPNAVSTGLTGLTPNTTYHFRIDATNADGGSATGADQTFTTPANPATAAKPTRPKLTGLGVTHKVFAVGAALTPLTGMTARKHPRGTVFSFVLDQAATVTVKVMVGQPGRFASGRCQAASRKLRKHPRCTRYLLVATLTRSGHAGSNSMPFTGRLPGRVLARGSYHAVFTASNMAGRSAPQAIGFTIVKH